MRADSGLLFIISMGFKLLFRYFIDFEVCNGEKMSLGNKICGIVLMSCLFFVVNQRFVFGKSDDNYLYDGNWWHLIPIIEQSGFLDGDRSCYCHEYHGKKWLSNLFTIPDYDLITRFYRKNPDHIGDFVVDVLSNFSVQPLPPLSSEFRGPAEQEGEDDGLVWRQRSVATGPELGQRGYIEGYLACHVRLNHNHGGTFSKPAAEYVRLITQWYGFVRETDAIDPDREPVAIADVLYKFRDQAPDGAK